MSRIFSLEVSQLWAAFGEPPPPIESGGIDLVTDDLTLRLEDDWNGDGIVVSSKVGPLAADQRVRESQIRTILSLNLDYLPDVTACVHLSGEILTISAKYPYSGARRSLSRLIDDVLALHQAHKYESLGVSESLDSTDINKYEREDVIFIR